MSGRHAPGRLSSRVPNSMVPQRSSGGSTPQLIAARALCVWGTTVYACSTRRLCFASSFRKGVVSRFWL